jgi:hypothetical protein
LDGEIRKMPMLPRDVDDWRLQEKEIRTRWVCLVSFAGVQICLMPLSQW